MKDKSWVGMSVCFLCGEVKELLLDARMKETLPQKACFNKEPCTQCQKWMKEGIILISVNEKLSGKDLDNPYRTGGWCVIKEEALRRMINEGPLLDGILKQRVAFLPDEVWDKLGLPRKEQEND